MMAAGAALLEAAVVTEAVTVGSAALAAGTVAVVPGYALNSMSGLETTLLGQRCHIHWPYLQEAVIVGVSDESTKVRVVNVETSSAF